MLVGLGVSSLSMAPGKVPAVRVALAAHTHLDCQQLAAAARDAATATEARDSVRAAASRELLDIL